MDALLNIEETIGETNFKETFLYVANISKSLAIEKGEDEVNFQGNIPADKHGLEAQLIVELGLLHPAYYIYRKS